MYNARSFGIRKPFREIMKVKSASSISAPFNYVLNKPSDHKCTFAETMFGSVGANSPLI